MQPLHLFGAGALLAGFGWFLAATGGAGSPVGSTPSVPLIPPLAEGHYVLVVDGDRDQLDIRHASRKVEPWAGVAKGFTSEWTLSIHDDRGALLAEVPIDVTPFAVGVAEKGQPVRVEGCIVRDAHIAMLVNVPRFAAAATYTFARGAGAAGRVLLGTATGAHVRELAEEGR